LVNTKNAGGNVEILTGTHGTVDGALIAERQFFADDLMKWGNTAGVTVRDVTRMTTAELHQVINGAGRIICAWCMSERSVDVLTGLGHLP
jgi:hypothetical protein